ncbi:hypothetical protein [Caballeronia hypogeia]
MMDAVEQFELAHGIYPVAFDRRWHCGVHLAPNMHGDEANVYAIADGEVVAYRVCQNAIDAGHIEFEHMEKQLRSIVRSNALAVGINLMRDFAVFARPIENRG